MLPNSDSFGTSGVAMRRGESDRTNPPNGLSDEELKRQKRRRRLARMTPEQRRKALQYQRRHNEADGRLFYCDYCDLFISTSQKCWRAHLVSARHIDAVEGYYTMAANVESQWVNDIHETIAKDRLRRIYRDQQAVVGRNAATPLPPMQIAPHITVGGNPPSSALSTAVDGGPPIPPTTSQTPLVSIRVGEKMIYAPSIKVANKALPPLATPPPPPVNPGG
ncbi:unnamed protein product [Phytomonas sp. EM1]|nr:unnamed protein product [Phytomonas sp. EM1]|eukprot:CCW63804.1 unnamed protein product [Phytomonas sp. isolate EM1]